MKTILILTAILVIPSLLLSLTGIGIIVGEPTGLSLKHWIGERTAWDAALAYSFVDKEHYYFHANYLYHNTGPFDNMPIPWYWGLGFNVRYREKAEDQLRIAGRIPLGLNYMFERFPGEIFIEVSPALDVIPKVDFSFGAAVGFRIYFG